MFFQMIGRVIVFLGLQGVHPPPDVAADYQAVVAAIQKKQASILMAQAESNATLTLLTGSVAKSQEIYDLGHRYLKAAQEGDEELVEKLTEQIGDFLANAEGDVFKILRQAQSYAFAKEVNAEAAGKRFKDQIKAYKASPDIYRQIYLLNMLEEVLKDIRKYVIVAGDEETQIYIIDLKEDITPSIYDLNIDEIAGKK